MKEDQKITFFEITGEKQLKTRLTSWSPKPNLEGTLVGLKIGRVNENDEDQYSLAGNILNGTHSPSEINPTLYSAAAKPRAMVIRYIMASIGSSKNFDLKMTIAKTPNLIISSMADHAMYLYVVSKIKS